MATDTPTKEQDQSKAEVIDKTAGTDGASLVEVIGEFRQEMTELKKDIAEAKKPIHPDGQPNGEIAKSFTARRGEDPLTSRPFSLMRLAKALAMRASHTPHYSDLAKVEFGLSEKLHQAFAKAGMSWPNANVLVPLGADLLPINPVETVDGVEYDGLPVELIKECRDTMATSMSGYDPDEYDRLAKRFPQAFAIQKDLSANDVTAGGSLVAFASQGELIEQLKAQEVFSRAGAQQFDLPPQGKIRFPRQTGSVTIASQGEGATISGSTPSTSELELSAKAYSGLVDIPEELLKFSTSISVEAWLRAEFTREIALKADRDMISGGGGTAIQGVIGYSGIRIVIAGTTGGNGDTLDPPDTTLMHANLGDQNAPLDRGFFYAMTNTMWAALMTRNDGTNFGFWFNVGPAIVGGGRPRMTLNGDPVITSTQIPTTRAKGSGTTLTLVLAGVGAEWLIARAGVVEIAMTNSDASKFQQRLTTMRGTQYIDAGPKHENSFGMIDTLLEQ